MNLELIRIGLLRPLADNPRKITDAARDRLRASITRFGLFRPLLVWGDGCIIGGAQRLAVLQSMQASGDLPLRVELASGAVVEVTDEVPCVRFDGTESEARAVALRDNHQDGEWDDSLLRDFIRGMDVELQKLTGWDDTELRKLIANHDRPKADEVVRTPGPADSVPGRLYELGPHRLVCGDSSTPEPWAALAGQYAIVWTDPPYGVSYSSFGRTGGPDQHRPIANDALNETELAGLLSAVWGNLYQCTVPGGVWYVAAPANSIFGVFANTISALSMWRHTLTWVKDGFVVGRCDRHYQHESIFYGWKDGKHSWTGGRKRSSVLFHDRPRRSDEHPTMKPVALIKECIECHGEGLVCDPFGGSGSTLVAAHELGLVAHLIEKDPVYCDVIRRRWTAIAEAAGIDPGTGGLK